MKQPLILISVPHTVCTKISSKSYHNCDLVAMDAAEHLYSELEGYSNIFIGNRNRNRMDLNRFKSRDTSFRCNLRKYFQPGVVLLDVHSFPPRFTEKYDHAHVAVGTNKKVIEPYIADLSQYLYDKKIYSFAIGGLTTDIVTEAKHYGVQAYLLEYNENHETTYRKKIAKVIANYFLSV